MRGIWFWFTCTFVFMCSTRVIGVNINYLSVSPKSNTVQVGNQVTFNCTSGIPNAHGHNVQWFNGSTPFPHTSYQVLVDGTYQLVLTGVQISDSGRYTCCVVHNGLCDGEKKDEVELIVGLPPVEVEGLRCYSHSAANGYCVWNNSRTSSHLATNTSLQRCPAGNFHQHQCKKWEAVSCNVKPVAASINADNVCFIGDEMQCNKDLRYYHFYRVQSQNQLGIKNTYFPVQFSVVKDSVPLPPGNITIHADTNAIHANWRTPPGFDLQCRDSRGRPRPLCQRVGYKVRYRYNSKEEWTEERLDYKNTDICNPMFTIDLNNSPLTEVCLQISSENHLENTGKIEKKLWSDWSEPPTCVNHSEAETTTANISWVTSPASGANTLHVVIGDGSTFAKKTSATAIKASRGIVIVPQTENNINALITGLAVLITAVGVALIFAISCCYWKEVTLKPDIEVKMPGIVYKSCHRSNTRFKVPEPEEFDDLWTPELNNTANAGKNNEKSIYIQDPDSVNVTLFQNLTYIQHDQINSTWTAEFDHLDSAQSAEFDHHVEVHLPDAVGTVNLESDDEDMEVKTSLIQSEGSEDPKGEGNISVKLYYVEEEKDEDDEMEKGEKQVDGGETTYYIMSSQQNLSLVRCDEGNQNTKSTCNDKSETENLDNKILKYCEKSPLQYVEENRGDSHYHSDLSVTDKLRTDSLSSEENAVRSRRRFVVVGYVQQCAVQSVYTQSSLDSDEDMKIELFDPCLTTKDKHFIDSDNLESMYVKSFGGIRERKSSNEEDSFVKVQASNIGLFGLEIDDSEEQKVDLVKVVSLPNDHPNMDGEQNKPENPELTKLVTEDMDQIEDGYDEDEVFGYQGYSAMNGYCKRSSDWKRNLSDDGYFSNGNYYPDVSDFVPLQSENNP